MKKAGFLLSIKLKAVSIKQDQTQTINDQMMVLKRES